MYYQAFLSTLSLRRATCQWRRSVKLFRHFYPRSPCGERPAENGSTRSNRNFYPRSPCGERQQMWGNGDSFIAFLSTLSLRRATHRHTVQQQHPQHISIHALLAESDPRRHWAKRYGQAISIHALLAESDNGSGTSRP